MMMLTSQMLIVKAFFHRKIANTQCLLEVVNRCKSVFTSPAVTDSSSPGSMLADLDMFPEMCISRAEYLEHGCGTQTFLVVQAMDKQRVGCPDIFFVESNTKTCNGNQNTVPLHLFCLATTKKVLDHKCFLLPAGRLSFIKNAFEKYTI